MDAVSTIADQFSVLMSQEGTAMRASSEGLPKGQEAQRVEAKKNETGFYEELRKYVEQNDEFFGHFLDLIDDKWDIGRWPTFWVVVAVIVGILLAGDHSAKMLSFVLCCAYPLQRTQQLLLGLLDSAEDGYDYWLVFWVFFVIITANDYLLSGNKGYWLVKTAITLYLYFPVTNGLKLLIEPILKPIVFIVAGNFDREVLSKANPALLKFLHLDLLLQLDKDVLDMVQGMTAQQNPAKEGVERSNALNPAELSKLIDQCKSVLDTKKEMKPAVPAVAENTVLLASAGTSPLTSTITSGNVTPNRSHSAEIGGHLKPKLSMSHMNAILKQLLNSGHGAEHRNEAKSPFNVFQAMLDKQAQESKRREAARSDSLNVEAIINRFMGSRGKQLQQEALQTMRYLKNLERAKQLKKEKDDANERADKST